MALKLVDLRRVLGCLDESAVKRFFRAVIGQPYKPECTYCARHCLMVLIADWLAHLGVFTDAQQYEIIRCHANDLDFFATALEECQDQAEKPVFTLAIADYRWVSCSRSPVFFDVTESEQVEALPCQAVTHVICDLTALWVRANYRLAQLQGGKHDGADGQGSGHADAGQSGPGPDPSPTSGGPGPATES